MANFKGAFSFKNDKIAETKIRQNLNMRFVRITPAIARVFMVDDTNAEVNLPEGLLVRDETNQADIQPFGDSYFLAWSDNYRISINGEEILTMYNQRQWAFSGPANRQVYVQQV